MYKKLIAATIVAGSLLALQGSALAQVGSSSFALPDADSLPGYSTWNQQPGPTYYNYAGPEGFAPQPSVNHHGHYHHR